MAFLDADIVLPPHDQVSAVFLLTMNDNYILPVGNQTRLGYPVGTAKVANARVCTLALMALNEAGWATFPCVSSCFLRSVCLTARR